MIKILIIALSFICSACGSSRGGHCDAYGSVDNNTTEITYELITVLE